MTDRGFWLAGLRGGGNVRGLMYQSLIFAAVLRDEARRLGAAFDAEDLQRLADALVDGVRRNPEPERDLLRAHVLVDEPQAVQLSLAEPGDAVCGKIAGCS